MKINNLREILEGCLLGDGSILNEKDKYFRFIVASKSKKLLEWIGKIIKNISKKVNIYYTQDKRNKVWKMYVKFRNNELLISLERKWYKKVGNRRKKVIPKDLRLTPTVLLFWYLGDGSLIRRKDSNRLPFIVFATNCFSKSEINLLIKKLKKLGLNFYPVKYKSGFTGKSCGYCIYSSTKDETVFKFFKLIGFEPPKEIENCILGKKGKYRKVKCVKDKWPNKEDWIRILSNVKEIGRIFKEKRKELGLTQSQLAKRIGISREHIRDIENEKRRGSVRVVREIMKEFKLGPFELLRS